ncbi:hypothetical protein AAON49_09585 [Pseudotenacibaculum sp. MALMAid0570]|uniref:hypothetical protein n=1 Tax=Pseudotenacibaculum sp. MALMAid0570 TaxID=3143938 RepID=UPI0032DFC52A
MKKILVFSLFLFVGISASAQFVNRGSDPRLRGQSRPQNDKLPEFNPERTIGLVIYNYERVVKKIGVKKKSDNAKKIKSIFTKFNRSLNDIKRINSFTLKEMKTTFEATRREAIKTKDFSGMQAVQKQMAEAFKPIVDAILKKEEELDASLKPLLSEKQFRKWLKYKSRVKKKG